jgi:mannose-1-phosphate guanylyltransferase
MSKAPTKSSEPQAHAVILAGGRGTRFWPRSRTRTPKQLLNIVGTQTMIQQTVDRLSPLFPAERVWVVTNGEQSAEVQRQLPKVPAAHVLAEPIGRNTAAAIGLAAIHLQRTAPPDALMAILPSDHVVNKTEQCRRIVSAALKVAARPEPGPLVCLGIPPTRPDTGFGYIESARKPRGQKPAAKNAKESVRAVRRFTEKPPLATARRYVASGRYLWNAGMFFWRVDTFLALLQRLLPKTHAALQRLADTIGTPRYAAALRRIYPTLENISVDYAILEPASRDPRRSPVFVLPAAIGWSDIGSWAAVYELLATKPGENVSPGQFLAIDAKGNFLWSPQKLIAAVGISDLVVVDTPDALLICPRDRAQDVGQIVKQLEAQKASKLL